MVIFFRYWKKPLTLNEILEEIEHLDDNASVPDALVVFPPTNANEDVTDEDSGDDEYVVMDNLPGSILQTEAEPVFNRDVDNSNRNDINAHGEDTNDDSDEDIPLSHFMKYKKKMKCNNWVQEDITSKLPRWQNESVANNNTQTLEMFYFFFLMMNYGK